MYFISGLVRVHQRHWRGSKKLINLLDIFCQFQWTTIIHPIFWKIIQNHSQHPFKNVTKPFKKSQNMSFFSLHLNKGLNLCNMEFSCHLSNEKSFETTRQSILLKMYKKIGTKVYLVKRDTHQSRNERIRRKANEENALKIVTSLKLILKKCKI